MANLACDIDYVVQPGDTYYSIAESHYGSRRDWQIVFEANRSASGQPGLFPGNQLYIPCLAGQEPAVAAVAPPVPATEAEPADAVIADAEGIAPEAQDPQDVDEAVALDSPDAAENAPTEELAADPVAEDAAGEDAIEPVAEAPAPVPEPVEYPPNPARVAKEVADLKLVTGGANVPFTGKFLPQQGLITELVDALLDATPSKVSYSVDWEDDWDRHFDLLDAKAFDMGFPWLRPDCEADPANDRCANFHYSDPLLMMPIMLFVRDDNQFQFEQDSDVHGRSICRPAGSFTYDLDGDGRRWIADEHITYVEGETAGDCFYKVLVGDVDAASVSLFLGASTILEMGLRNKVVPLERPVSEEGLHLVIAKRHWRGTTHLYRVNAGLKALKADGRYQEIVSRHLEAFQSRLQ